MIEEENLAFDQGLFHEYQNIEEKKILKYREGFLKKSVTQYIWLHRQQNPSLLSFYLLKKNNLLKSFV